MEETYEPKTLLEAIRYFSDPHVCVRYFVGLRWPDGIQCPYCESKETPSYVSTRRIFKCKSCRKQYSPKTGTIFEDSALGLDKWLTALWIIATSKNGISSHELHRSLGVTQKTAWFMSYRIRLAMEVGSFEKLSGTVEADETFAGGKAMTSETTMTTLIRTLTIILTLVLSSLYAQTPNEINSTLSGRVFQLKDKYDNAVCEISEVSLFTNDAPDLKFNLKVVEKDRDEILKSLLFVNIIISTKDGSQKKNAKGIDGVDGAKVHKLFLTNNELSPTTFKSIDFQMSAEWTPLKDRPAEEQQERREQAVRDAKAVQVRAKQAQERARQAQELARQDRERARIRAACTVIYQKTADMKINDLTVKEEQQVRACQTLGLYPPR